MIEWGIPGKASVLVDGQFGSTGKGLAAAWLAAKADHVDIATTAAGAQAGHTTKYRDGREFVCFHLPTTAVALHNEAVLAYINAGAIVSLRDLEQEMWDCRMPPIAVQVHPRAAVISDEHRTAEREASASTTKLASTQKGVGAALADKIWRRSPLIGGSELPNWLQVGPIDLNDKLISGKSVIIETPQGTDLGINHGYSYPHCTSRDCYVTSSLEYAGVHPHFLGPVAMVVRTFPIRVGHIVNELGETVGTSGPFYPDSSELDWERDLPGIEPERTTVTKRVRRIATWSDQQYEHALKLNRPSIVVLTFCNYLKSGDEFMRLRRRMRQIEHSCGWRWNQMVHAYSFSPFTDDVTTDLEEAISWFDTRNFGVANAAQ